MIYLKTPVKARYVKLEPQAWKNHMSMRAAVLTVHSINYNTNATGFNNGIYLPIEIATEEEIKAQNHKILRRRFFVNCICIK